MLLPPLFDFSPLPPFKLEPFVLALFLGLVITAFNIWQLAELQRQHYEESARVRGGGVAAGTGLAYSLYAKHPDSGLVQHDFMVIPFLGLDNQFDFI